MYDKTGDGAVDMYDVAELFKSHENELTELKGDGDFRSPECLSLMDEADIVVTNPPFSLFREYVAVLMAHKKKFVIIGNKNALTYKEIFPLFQRNKLWVGATPMSIDLLFIMPRLVQEQLMKNKKAGSAYRVVDGQILGRSSAIWFTNLDIKKRHEEMILIKRYSPECYPKYDNYDAIEVGKTSDIPCDYAGMMGVPVTFLDKYNPEQFDIVGIAKAGAGDPALKTKEYPLQRQIDKNGKSSNVRKLNDGPAINVPAPPKSATYYIVNGKYYIQTYARILIRNKHPEPPREAQ